jgi:DNA-binding PadR family transcriptional regulator
MAQTVGRPQTARWMRGASASVRGALLGLVLERPGQGGDLANRLRIRLGETWRLDPNDVYRLLEGLEQEGLVRSLLEPHAEKGRRPTVTYHATEETAPALTLWMETLLPREPVRLALQAKLAVARPQDAERMMDALSEYEDSCLMLAQLVAPSFADGPRSWTALCLECTRDAAYSQLEAEVKWAQRTRERIAEQVTRASHQR